MRKITLLAVLLTAFFVGAYAQPTYQLDESKDYEAYPYWIEMMQDPDANFYATVEAFNRYWKNREITPGSGYKVFKRWEYYWRTRIHPDGTRRPADEAINAYFDFLETNSTREEYFEGNWTNTGPIEQPGVSNTGQPNGNGRVNALAFHPTDPDIIYAGAPAGGLWITYDGGEDWITYTDNLPTLGVSAIVIDYTDPDIVFIGTGDRDAGDAPGMGVMKSEDGGITFEFANDGMGDVTVGMMVMHPDFHLHLLAATSGGIYKTTNGGQDWSRKETGNFKDIVYHVNDPDIVYATASGRFYRSTDAGDTWTRITSGINSADRGVIGVTEADPDVVYFHTVQGSVYAATYRSDDTGLNFTQKATSPNIMSWNCNGGSGGQGWYDLDVAVDPNNADIVYSGGVNIWKSTNGTASWSINAHWYGDCGRPAVHADCHILEYHPLNGRLYAGNDGGVYWTDDGGNTWNEITSGLAISQVYKMGQSKTNPDKVMNGYQDNGTATYLGEEDGWLTVMGGDGMDCAYDHIDERYAYGEYYYGSISRIFNNINQGNISNGIGESGAWVTPFALDVTDPETMYVGMKNIWRSNNIRSGSVQWQRISDLGGSNCNAVEQSEADNNIFFVAHANQSLWRTDNLLSDSPGWINLSASLPVNGVITEIETHPENPDVVFITLNYKVFKSEDRGESWEDITLNLPTASTNTIEYYKNTRDGLFLGTDAGIYYKDNDMNEWVLFSEGFPVAAEVTEIEIYYDPDGPSGDLVRASTYGRGLWTSPTFYSTPEADFMASETQIPAGCAIDFYDRSGGVPHEWSWTFEGATPGSSTEQNPAGIAYQEEGTFAVTLTVTNPAGEDTETFTGYITVSDAMLPIVDFSSPDTAFCTPGIAHFYDDSEGCPTAWLWEFEPDNVTFLDGTDANSPNPVVKFYDGEPYTVSLTVTNSAGSTTDTKVDYIQSGGYTPYFLEPFSSSSINSSGWQVENPDGSVTWDMQQVGGTEPGTIAAVMDFRNYQVIGQRDRLISPPFNLTGMSSAWLEFRHAYAERWEDKTDSLIVYVSDDCGASWTRVFSAGEDGNGSFATHEPTEDFWPQSESDWCGMGWGASCISIDLSNWLGNDGIKIAFETYANFGNPIVIDNVTISQFVGENELTLNSSDDIVVFPNPNNGTFQVSLSKDHGFQDLRIFNHVGQLVHQQGLAEDENQLYLNAGSKLSPGVYYLRLSGNGHSTSQKLIVN